MGALALKRLLKKPIRKLLDTRKFISGLCLHLLHVTNDDPKMMTLCVVLLFWLRKYWPKLSLQMLPMKYKIWDLQFSRKAFLVFSFRLFLAPWKLIFTLKAHRFEKYGNFDDWNPAGNYMFKVNKRNTRIRSEISSKLTIKTLERHWRRSGVYCYLWTYFTPCSSVSIVNFEQTFRWLQREMVSKTFSINPQWDEI